MSGDEQKLLTQISAVETNTKFNYQRTTKDMNSNDLPVNQKIHILAQKIVQNFVQNFDLNKIEKALRNILNDLPNEEILE